MFTSPPCSGDAIGHSSSTGEVSGWCPLLGRRTGLVEVFHLAHRRRSLHYAAAPQQFAIFSGSSRALSHRGLAICFPLMVGVPSAAPVVKTAQITIARSRNFFGAGARNPLMLSRPSVDSEIYSQTRQPRLFSEQKQLLIVDLLQDP